MKLGWFHFDGRDGFVIRQAAFLIPMVLCLLVGFSSCTDFRDDKSDGKQIGNQFDVCKLDSSSLSKILQEEITEPLNCVEENLVFFSNLVQNKFTDESGKPVPNLSYDQLDQFIRENYPDQVDNLKYVDVFFQAAYLLFGDEYGFISRQPGLGSNAVIRTSSNGEYRCPTEGPIHHLDNLCLMMRLLKVFNKNAAHVYKLLDEAPEELSYEAFVDLRTEVQLGIGNVSSFVSTYILEPRIKNQKNLNADFDLLKMLEIFKDEENADLIEKVKKLLYLKRILVGGQESIFGFSDFSEFMAKSKRLGVLTFNLIYFSTIDFESEEGRFSFLESTFSLLENIMHFKIGEKKVLITMDQYKQTAEIIQEEVNKELDDPIDFLKYKNLLTEAKILLSNPVASPEVKRERRDRRFEEVFKPTPFVVDDLYEILNKLIFMTGMAKTFAVLYEQNRKLMESPQAISKKFKFQNPFPANSVESSHFRRFVDVVKTLRYFREDNPLPDYSVNYRRSEKGIIEGGVLKYFVDLLVFHYEEKYPCDSKKPIALEDPMTGEIVQLVTTFPRNEKETDTLRVCKDENGNPTLEDYAGTANLFQSEGLVYEFKDLLVDNNVFFAGRELVAAQNLVLLSDIFQQSSNGNSLVEGFEGVEFLMQVLAGINIRQDLLDELGRRCEGFVSETGEPGVYDYDAKGDPRFSVACVRKNFYKVLETKFLVDKDLPASESNTYSVFQHLPRLGDFYRAGDQTRLDNYVSKLEYFTRTCTAEDVPMDAVDTVAMFGGLFSVESTFNRFDVNGGKKNTPPDNVIDVAELRKGFDTHFFTPVKNISGYPDIWRNKIGFRYLIEKEEYPDTAGLKGKLTTLAVLFRSIPKWVQGADRATIAAILASIRDFGDGIGASNPNSKFFDCNKLKAIKYKSREEALRASE